MGRLIASNAALAPASPSPQQRVAALLAAFDVLDALGFITFAAFAPYMWWWVFLAPAERYVEPSLLVFK